MLWIKAFHIIFMVTWFAGLFYLPRLFVYHTQTSNDIEYQRFCLMEKRLYRGIMMPGAIITTLLGFWLLSYSYSAYMKAGWMHVKLLLVILVWLYHSYCGYLIKLFRQHRNPYSTLYYRIFNEIPVLFLIGIVIAVVVKP